MNIICDDEVDGGGGGGGGGDDIYIMMQCLSVCHKKSSLPPGSFL